MKTTKTMIVHLIDRCLTAGSDYIADGADGEASARMRETFRQAAREVSVLELGGIKKAGLFLRPMEKELVKRHGPLVGREIYWDFVDSFWIQSWTEVPLDDNRLNRPIEQNKQWHWRGLAHRTMKRLLNLSEFSPTPYKD